MGRNLRPAVFLDRDGVINAELGHVHTIDQFRVLPGVFEALRLLREQGYALVVVTNQAGIAKGMYRTEDFQRLTQHMVALFASEGVRFDGIYHCPHHPEGSDPDLSVSCNCRKPEPGMLLRAAQEIGLALDRSFLVGDKVSDMQAGRAAGLRGVVLVRSGHTLDAASMGCADSVCGDLRDAAEWICRRSAAANASLHASLGGD